MRWEPLAWWEWLILAVAALWVVVTVTGCATTRTTGAEGCAPAKLEALTATCEVAIASAPQSDVDGVAGACLEAVATWKALCTPSAAP